MKTITHLEFLSLFAEVLEVPTASLSGDSSPENVTGWDSAKSMEILTLLEEMLSVEFSAEEIGTMTSIDAILSILETHGIAVT